MEPSHPRLELRGVARTYRVDEQLVQALTGVTLAPVAGVVTALLGRSGCGKSTLLNLAGAMDFPDSGDVLIDGQATSGLSDRELTLLRRSRIGFVFQSFQLLPTLTVLENVELPLLLAGERRTAARASEMLGWVGLGDRVRHMPHQLSGGQMQRVAVARAMVHSPEILLADEPTGNLDSTSGGHVLELIARTASDFGATVLLATHSEEAASIARTRVYLRDGRIERVE